MCVVSGSPSYPGSTHLHTGQVFIAQVCHLSWQTISPLCNYIFDQTKREKTRNKGTCKTKKAIPDSNIEVLDIKQRWAIN